MSNTKQKTALMKVIEHNDELRHAMQIIQNFIDGDYQDQASLKEAWNLISDYVTMSESHLPEERQQIIDAFCSTNTSKGMKTFSSVLKDEGEQYYNETYGHDKE